MSTTTVGSKRVGGETGKRALYKTATRGTRKMGRDAKNGAGVVDEPLEQNESPPRSSVTLRSCLGRRTRKVTGGGATSLTSGPTAPIPPDHRIVRHSDASSSDIGFAMVP